MFFLTIKGEKLILFCPTERLLFEEKNSTGLCVDIGVGNIIGNINGNIAMTCDGVKGCSGAFISNGNKVIGMQISKYDEPEKKSSYISYT